MESGRGGNPKKPRVLILALLLTSYRSLGQSLLFSSLFIYETEGLVGQVSKVRDSSEIFRLRMGFPHPEFQQEGTNEPEWLGSAQQS